MGVPQPEREVISVDTQGEEEAAPVDQEQMAELRQIFEEVAEELAVVGEVSGDTPATLLDQVPEAIPIVAGVAALEPPSWWVGYHPGG